ncbi:MAG: bifunctional aldolase/short-chain dehydrogenase [Candidatus Omnitrophica bacterium]|nr:bifunctional aldolase/short-chain dehydrogenase [Candidatus Omnitrophota bacterium]
MKNLFSDSQAKKIKHNPLAMRVYTSRLLGQDTNLVLHGGGNTSVKTQVKNIFGEMEDVLYVKGSGWDLATIEAEGFAPVRMDALLKMAQLEHLSDTAMVKAQRAAMTDPYAPNPSVEAILHAIIPFQYVDHTHADSVVTITNTHYGAAKIREIYGEDMLIVPYVMPGFILAKKVYEMTRDIDWEKITGMILLNHGVFTFADDAKESYERMIQVVSKAEQYIKKNSKTMLMKSDKKNFDHLAVTRLRKAVSHRAGRPLLARLNKEHANIQYSNLKDLHKIATQGPLTPDHVIRTKRIPMIIKGNLEQDVEYFAREYQIYFHQHCSKGQTCLDPAPRWAVWPGYGTVNLGETIEDVQIIDDITAHTIKCIIQAQQLGGWRALKAKDIFEVEYWDLEQAKLKKKGARLPFQGKVVLVTGAASGIGKSCVEVFAEQGAVVSALDINSKVLKLFDQKRILGIECDLRKEKNIVHAIKQTIECFGGIDLLVANAGMFPSGKLIADMDQDLWEKSLALNLTSQQMLLKHSIPYLKNGLNPAVVFIGSKNVPAPGYGAAAYSAAKAGATQLARIAALELAGDGIRVNVIHPNQVFDTGIWSQEILKNRAAHYHMSVQEYKTNNLMKTEITSLDVARMAAAMAGDIFAKTTAAQVPVDGGNERVV